MVVFLVGWARSFEDGNLGFIPQDLFQDFNKTVTDLMNKDNEPPYTFRSIKQRTRFHKGRHMPQCEKTSWGWATTEHLFSLGEGAPHNETKYE